MENEDPWAWMQPHDVRRFGEVIMDPKEQERWCRAVLLGGLPFMWRKAEVGGERIVVDALVRRRAAEKALFLTPEGDAWVPAPSPILKPLLDSDAQGLVPPPGRLKEWLQAMKEGKSNVEGWDLPTEPGL